MNKKTTKAKFVVCIVTLNLLAAQAFANGNWSCPPGQPNDCITNLTNESNGCQAKINQYTQWIAEEKYDYKTCINDYNNESERVKTLKIEIDKYAQQLPAIRDSYSRINRTLSLQTQQVQMIKSFKTQLLPYLQEVIKSLQYDLLNNSMSEIRLTQSSLIAEYGQAAQGSSQSQLLKHVSSLLDELIQALQVAARTGSSLRDGLTKVLATDKINGVNMSALVRIAITSGLSQKQVIDLGLMEQLNLIDVLGSKVESELLSHRTKLSAEESRLTSVINDLTIRRSASFDEKSRLSDKCDKIYNNYTVRLPGFISNKQAKINSNQTLLSEDYCRKTYCKFNPHIYENDWRGGLGERPL